VDAAGWPGPSRLGLADTEPALVRRSMTRVTPTARIRRLGRGAVAIAAFSLASACASSTGGAGNVGAAAYLSLPTRYTTLIDAAGSRCPAITPEVIAAQIAMASPGEIFEPSTWSAAGSDFDGDGRANANDPADSIQSLGRYMCELHGRVERARAVHSMSGGDLRLTLAAYRVGFASLVGADGVPRSARTYVDAVEAAVEGQRDMTVVSPLPGYRDSDNYGVAGTMWSSGYHTGDDFPAACGTPVVAATTGVVRIRTDQPWAGVALVEVLGGNGTVTWYAHMQQVDVSDGEPVLPGQSIGAVGDLGNAYGCHLHFEVHPDDGDAVDPHEWLVGNGVDL
jgi:murein DD-endopeptidase MepM/ murein hydrolase activator NlpD